MLKVLFVSSGNSLRGISPIIKNQGESLKENIILDYFTIKGKGIKGYIMAIPKLKKLLRENNYDIIHSHYSLSAYTASLARAKPHVVSLMGSDVKAKHIYKIVIKIFNYFFWDKVIVKSEDMRDALKLNEVLVIPNGVDFNRFKPINKKSALKETEWETSKKHILFAASPNRPEKNYTLAKKAFQLLENTNLELHCLENISNEMIPYYYNAADVVLLTSLWEGSPNVIKEAMACNVPIVSTDVGDVKKVFGGIEGCYITSMSTKDVAEKLKKAITFNKRTNGRDTIFYLNEDLIAKSIISLYNNILSFN